MRIDLDDKLGDKVLRDAARLGHSPTQYVKWVLEMIQLECPERIYLHVGLNLAGTQQQSSASSGLSHQKTKSGFVKNW